MPDSIQNADTIDAQESDSESVSPEHPVTDINNPEKSTPASELVGKVNLSSAMPPVSDGIEKSAHLPSLAISVAFKGPATMMAKALADFPDVASMANIKGGIAPAGYSIGKSTLEKFVQLPSMTESVMSTATAAMAKIGAGLPDIAAMIDMRGGIMAAFDSIDKSTLEKFAQLPSMTESVTLTAATMAAKVGAGLPDIAAMIDMRGGIMAAFDSIDKSVLEQLTRVAIPVIPQLDIEAYSKMFSEIQSHMSARVSQTMALYESAIAQSLGQFREAVAQRNALADRAPKTVADLSTLSQQFETAMMDLQWPAPMIDMDFALMQDIVTLHDNLPRQEADTRVGRMLSRIYDADCLNERLNFWKSYKWIGPRMHILAMALGAHTEGKYELSIPVLVVQIEGIILEGSRFGGWVVHSSEKTKVEEACERDGSFVGRLAKNLFVTAFFQQFTIGQPVVPNLSRHAILHGVDTDYPTPENSLKLILLLDCTLNVFDEQRSAPSASEVRLAVTP
jgi:hypothetical protein